MFSIKGRKLYANFTADNYGYEQAKTVSLGVDRQSIKAIKLPLFNQFFICIDSAFFGQRRRLFS